ncbi:MAG: DUF1576 domain-containing protein [Bacillota bacterium]
MTQVMQKIVKKYTIPIIFLISIIITLTLEPLSSMLSGYRQILTNSSVLLSDYLLIGGLAATFLNVILTTGLNILILKWLKIEITGSIFACLFTIAGFAFFGKNLYNALPLYFGILLYCKATKTKCKDHILVFLLSSGISPVTSFLIFGAGFSLPVGIILGIIAGTLIGFILPAFNAFSMKFHQGYNLYNTGFSMGVISMILTGILGSFGVDIIRSTELNNSYHTQLFILILIISGIFILLAFLENKDVLKRYPLIFKKSGRLLTDFSIVVGKDVTLLNIGIMGFLSCLLIYFSGIQINGPVMGAVLTILGFSAFGKHPLNAFPVVIGAILAIELTPLEWTIGSTLSVLFVTGLAPLAGQFGIIAGMIGGFIHVLITPLALNFQGGFDLYNNGFAAGFVCALLAPVYHVFLKARDDGGSWNRILPIYKKDRI